MRKASTAFRKMMGEGINFYIKALFTFPSGETKELNKTDFYITGNEYTDGAGVSSLAVGEALCKSLRFTLVNDDDRFSKYDFFNARIKVWSCLDIDDTTEEVLLGKFTVTTPESYGTQIEVNATDDMYKADVSYTSNLTYPASVRDILIDACSTLGMELYSADFPNNDYVVATKPTDITFRQLFGYIAMFAGGNARINADNQLTIVNYDVNSLITEGLDGGHFDPTYSTGDTADGGNFKDYSSGDTFDGGTFQELDRLQLLYSGKTPTIATDDVVITGVKLTYGEDSGIYGEEGYVLSLENQLASGDFKDACERIGKILRGVRFRPFSISHISNPLIEFGDLVYVFDRYGSYYISMVTDITYNWYGFTDISCKADNPLRNSSSYNEKLASQLTAFKQLTSANIESINDDIGGINEDIGEINEEIEDIEETQGNIQISLKRVEDGLESKVSEGDVVSIIKQNKNSILFSASGIGSSGTVVMASGFGNGLFLGNNVFVKITDAKVDPEAGEVSYTVEPDSDILSKKEIKSFLLTFFNAWLDAYASGGYVDANGITHILPVSTNYARVSQLPTVPNNIVTSPTANNITKIRGNSTGIGWTSDGTNWYRADASGSDKRLKKNIKDSEVNALEVINSIKVRQFDWKDTGVHWSAGVIADEIENIDEAMVSGGETLEDGSIIYKSVNNLELIGYMIKGMQEQQEQINELKALLKDKE